MSLRRVIAAPFRQRGQDRLAESQFIVALSLDRDWYSPDQASRIVDRGVGEGLLSRDGDELIVTFDYDTVDITSSFTPGEDLLRSSSAFEQAVSGLVDTGMRKREVVAGINEVQVELNVMLDAAAVIFAVRQGLGVSEMADAAEIAIRENH